MIDWLALRERFGIPAPLDAGTQKRLDAILWELGEIRTLLERQAQPAKPEPAKPADADEPNPALITTLEPPAPPKPSRRRKGSS